MWYPIALIALCSGVGGPGAEAPSPPPVRLTVLYDNWVGEEGTEADWGFAVLVERGDATVLFDTGTRPEVLRHNVQALRIDLGKVDAVVLSHDHGDHTGGLLSVLEEVSSVPVYAPSSFAPSFADAVEQAGATAVIDGEARTVAPGIRTTGTFAGDIPEQGLVVDTADGLLLITGCAHPGIVEMTRGVRERLGAPVHTVVGGFHLIRNSPEEVVEVMHGLEALGVHAAGPSHCTGKPATDQFREHFGERFVALGTGRRVEIRAANP
jgi:7,8-dihydropterin-6-yl-methyl-4-(beta-D-ribofuranosyl)aminobenzene 5'-phosphate synthase